MPIYKRIDEINKAYLQSLVDEKVMEDQSLEYKRDLNILSVLPKDVPQKIKDKEKREFCADVSAFANTDGGFLVYGIDQDAEGRANELSGIPRPDNFDKLRNSLFQIIGSGIEPQLYGVDIEKVELDEERIIILVQVPPSWIKPHWVGEKGCRTFLTRTSSGKDHLDIRNVRELFVLSETMVERIRDFRNDRINAIIEEEPYLPQNFGDIPKTVLHVVPFGSAASLQTFDILSLDNQFRDSFAKYGYNLEGIYGIDRNNTRAYSYFQVFRNGIIEFVDGDLVDGDGVLSALYFERQLFNEILPRIATFQKGLGVNPPYYVMLTLLGIGNLKLSLTRSQKERLGKTVGDSMYHRHEHVQFDRPSCMFPEIAIESLESENIHSQMRSVLDMVWQAAGLPRSFSYTEDGTWDGEK